jgi:chromosome segregation ATPase
MHGQRQNRVGEAFMANTSELVRELREMIAMERRTSPVHVVLPILAKLEELRAALEQAAPALKEPAAQESAPVHDPAATRALERTVKEHRARADRAERELADLQARFEMYRSEVEGETSAKWAAGLKAAGRAVTGILGRLRDRWGSKA